MRLNRLDLTRYGKFTDRVLDFGPRPASGPDLHLIYGPNEAGKSTAFDAFLSLLFGIPAQSSFDFLHAYKFMQIGGLVETGGTTLDLIRTKGNSNNLRSAKGEVLAPGALGQVLGGLDRNSYRAMFSLDKTSFKDGGKGILESQGELGQMLFAASSGLPRIAAALEEARGAADKLFKLRGRKTQVHELLERLTELKQQSQAIDVQAGYYDELRQSAGAAKVAHEAAEGARAINAARLRVVRQQRTALPLLAQRSAALDLHAPLAGLAEPPEGWSGKADALVGEETKLLSQVTTNAAALERLQAELQSLTPDARIFSAASQIEAQKPLRSRFDTAEIDLPRRRDEREVAQANVRHKISTLGLTQILDPAQLAIAAPQAAQLAALADAHGALATRLEAASTELHRATQDLEQAQAQAAANGPEQADTAALDALLARLLRDNLHGEQARLTRELAGEAAALATQVSGLHPFAGTAAQLASLPVPETSALQRWTAALRLAEDARLRATQAVTEKQAQLDDASAGNAAMLERTGLVDDAALAALTQDRAKAWQAHHSLIGAAGDHVALARTAQIYANAAQAERAALIAQAGQAAALEGLRSAGVGVARAKAALTSAQTQHIEAEAAQAHCQLDVRGALLACGLPDIWHVDDFAAWLQRRDAVVRRQTDYAQRLARLDLLESQLAQERRNLASAGLLAEDSMPFAALLAQGQSAAKRAATARATAEAKAKALAETARQQAERVTARMELAGQLQLWQNNWQTALQVTWLGQTGKIPSVVEVRAALALLAQISSGMQAIDKLGDQIDKMQKDQVAFAQALEQACTNAGLPFDPDNLARCSDDLNAALVRERQTQARQSDKRGALQQAEADRQRLADALQQHAAGRDGMLALYGVASLGALRTVLKDAAQAASLARDIAGHESAIVAAMRTSDLASALRQLEGCDLATLETEVDTLESAQTAADTDIQSLHTARRLAEAAFDRIGADSRTAILLEQRRTTLLELEETATRYLRLRLGAEALDAALRSYRESHRSSMLREAARRFATITGGSFSDLRTQMGEKGETLVGVQNGGSSQLAETMSEATRDQLFLALRMAGYREFAKSREPLPFIADDILETFDNARAAATFAMLKEVAEHGQVIYLTHHEHLCDIAREVCGDGVRIQSLSPTPASA